MTTSTFNFLNLPLHVPKFPHSPQSWYKIHFPQLHIEEHDKNTHERGDSGNSLFFFHYIISSFPTSNHEGNWHTVPAVKYSQPGPPWGTRSPKTHRNLRLARKHHVLNTPWLSLSPAGRTHFSPYFSRSLPLTKDFFLLSRCLGLFFRLGLCLRVRHGGTDGKWVVLWVNPPSLMFSYTRLLLFQPTRHEGAAKTPQAHADWSVSAQTPCLPAFDWLLRCSLPKRSSDWSEKLVLGSL